jgi:hypothetical protein
VHVREREPGPAIVLHLDFILSQYSVLFSARSTVDKYSIVLSLNLLDRHQDELDGRDRTRLMRTLLFDFWMAREPTPLSQSSTSTPHTETLEARTRHNIYALPKPNLDDRGLGHDERISPTRAPGSTRSGRPTTGRRPAWSPPSAIPLRFAHLAPLLHKSNLPRLCLGDNSSAYSPLLSGHSLFLGHGLLFMHPQTLCRLHDLDSIPTASTWYVLCTTILLLRVC